MGILTRQVFLGRTSKDNIFPHGFAVVTTTLGSGVEIFNFCDLSSLITNADKAAIDYNDEIRRVDDFIFVMDKGKMLTMLNGGAEGVQGMRVHGGDTVMMQNYWYSTPS